MIRVGAPLVALVVTLGASTASPRTEYDPLSVTAADPRIWDTAVEDGSRDRQIPLRAYLPESMAPAPVIVFSHGLGGNREGYRYLGVHWAMRGYVAVFMQHPGSDDSVWRDKPATRRMAALRKAASLENFLLRVADVPAVLDQLERWNIEPGHRLAGRLKVGRVGMAGHSFGAITAQAVGGQRAANELAFIDARVAAVAAMSPSGPTRDDPAHAFGNVKIPWMLLTGTKDDGPFGSAGASSRLVVFPALPPGGKYELVLDKAEHSAFSDRPLPTDSAPRNPRHHKTVLAVTTAFWDAYLRGDPAAKSWLDSDPVRRTLDPADRWQRK